MSDELPRDPLAIREYVSDLKTNIEGHWNRSGTREAHEQDGAVRALQRVLLYIDGRIGSAKHGGQQQEGPSAGSGEGGREPVARDQDAAALVPPAKVVPAAGSR